MGIKDVFTDITKTTKKNMGFSEKIWGCSQRRRECKWEWRMYMNSGIIKQQWCALLVWGKVVPTTLKWKVLGLKILPSGHSSATWC